MHSSPTMTTRAPAFVGGEHYPLADDGTVLMYDGGMGTEIEARIPESIVGEAW